MSTKSDNKVVQEDEYFLATIVFYTLTVEGPTQAVKSRPILKAPMFVEVVVLLVSFGCVVHEYVPVRADPFQSYSCPSPLPTNQRPELYFVKINAWICNLEFRLSKK